MSVRPDDPRRHERLIGLAGVLASLAASLVHIHFDPLPNPDAVTYLLAAQAWLDDGYAAAAAIYPSPNYSVSIAWLHSATGWSLLTSARCLDALILAALVVALQRLGRAAGASLRTQAIIVGLAILLPELNGYRSFLLRDFGYWMLSTVALVGLVRFAIEPDIRWAAAFAAAGGAAAVYRTEAVALLIFVPAALLFLPERRRFAAMLYAPIVAIVAAAVAIVVVAPASAWGRWLAEIARKFAELLAEIPLRAHAQWRGFADAVLDPRFHDYAGFGAVGGLATMVIVHVVIAASVPLFAIACVGALRGSFDRIDPRARPVLGCAVVVAIIGVAAALAARGIVQTRYAVSAALLIVVVAAFVIDDGLTRAVRPAQRRGLTTALGLLLAYFVAEDGYGLANSKHHYLQAADWVASHTERGARILSSDPRIVYLADRRVDARDLDARVVLDESPSALADYDYVIVLEPGIATESADPRSELRGVARFEGHKGDAIAIYRVGPTTAPGGATVSGP
jgi:hypothetical protein